MARPALTSAASESGVTASANVALATMPLRTAITLTMVLLIDSMPSHSGIGAAEQSAAADRGIERSGRRGDQCGNVVAGRRQRRPMLAAVRAEEQGILGGGINLLGMRSLIGDGGNGAAESAGIAPPAEAVHRATDTSGCGGKKPSGLHAPRHVRVDELHDFRARPGVHQPPMTSRVFAAEDAAPRYQHVQRLRLIRVRRQSHDVVGWQSAIDRVPSSSVILRTQNSKPRAGDVKDAAALRRNGNGRDVAAVYHVR